MEKKNRKQMIVKCISDQCFSPATTFLVDRLLCHMQRRMNNMEINKKTIILISNPTNSTKSIVIADPNDNVQPHTPSHYNLRGYHNFEHSRPSSAGFGDMSIPTLSTNFKKEF